MRSILLSLLILTISTGFAGAADLTVNADGSGPYPTIEAAVDAAVNGDRILLGEGTFTGAGNRDVTIFRDLEILAAAGSGTVVIDCQGLGRAFLLEYCDVTLRDLKIIGGEADLGGAIRQEEGHLSLEFCVLAGNHATSSGGAVHVFEEGSLELSHTVLDHNLADQKGGALSGDFGTWITMSHVTALRNGANAGGHLYLAENAGAIAESSIFACALDGGVVSIYYGATMDLSCCDVWNNRGGDYSGPLAGQNGVDGNLDVDPMLADPMAPEPVYGPVPASPVWIASACGWMGAAGAAGAYAQPVYGLATDGSGMFDTLAEAMTAVPDGASILLEDGVYRGEGFDALDPGTKNLVLGSRHGDPEACVLSREVGRFAPIVTFQGGQNSSTKVQNLTFTCDDTGPVSEAETLFKCLGASTMQVQGCRFSEGYTSSFWGSVFVGGGDDPATFVSFTDCDFSLETPVGYLLFATKWAGTLEGCTFRGTTNSFQLIDLNVVQTAEILDCDFHCTDSMFNPFMTVYTWEPADALILSGCRFTGGSNTMVHFSGDGRGTLTGCDFRDPISGGDDALVHFSGSYSGTYVVENCTFDGNLADGNRQGRCLWANGTTLTVSETTITGFGHNRTGPGINSSYTTLNLYETRIEECATSGRSGALHMDNTDAEIIDCSFVRNSAHVGGAMIIDESTVFMSYCNLVDNTADNEGGAIYLESDTGLHPSRFEHCIIAGNSSHGVGSAIAMTDAGVGLTLSQCTVAGNEHTESYYSTDYPSQVAVLGGARLDLQHSIISHSGTCCAVITGYETSTGIFVPYCSDIFHNAGGDWTGDIAGWLGVDENFSASPNYCDRPLGVYTLHAASPCLPDNNACSTQIGARGLGCGNPMVPVEDAGVPSAVSLNGAYPNPFNPRTTIAFALPREQTVSLTVHDAAGRLVRTLIDGRLLSGGPHEVVWNGRDNAGRGQSSGIYFMRLVTPDGNRRERMTLLR